MKNVINNNVNKIDTFGEKIEQKFQSKTSLLLLVSN